MIKKKITGIRLTAKNLKMLPIGKYTISAAPYVTSPNYVVEHTLHVYERDNERVYKIGDGIYNSFMLIILDYDDNSQYIEGITSINGFGFSTGRPHEFSRFTIQPRGSFKEMEKRSMEVFGTSE